MPISSWKLALPKYLMQICFWSISFLYIDEYDLFEISRDKIMLNEEFVFDDL